MIKNQNNIKIQDGCWMIFKLDQKGLKKKKKYDLWSFGQILVSKNFSEHTTFI